MGVSYNLGFPTLKEVKFGFHHNKLVSNKTHSDHARQHVGY